MEYLDYHHPQTSAEPRPSSPFRMYYGGAAMAVVTGFALWIFLSVMWRSSRWEILELPDRFPCAAIGALIMLALSSAVYTLIASREQSSFRHFLHGMVGGLTLLSATNFVERAANADLASPALQGGIYLGSLFITPIVMGCLSRYYAKKQRPPTDEAG